MSSAAPASPRTTRRRVVTGAPSRCRGCGPPAELVDGAQHRRVGDQLGEADLLAGERRGDKSGQVDESAEPAVPRRRSPRRVRRRGRSHPCRRAWSARRDRRASSAAAEPIGAASSADRELAASTGACRTASLRLRPGPQVEQVREIGRPGDDGARDQRVGAAVPDDPRRGPPGRRQAGDLDRACGDPPGSQRREVPAQPRSAPLPRRSSSAPNPPAPSAASATAALARPGTDRISSAPTASPDRRGRALEERHGLAAVVRALPALPAAGQSVRERSGRCSDRPGHTGGGEDGSRAGGESLAHVAASQPRR